MKNTIPAIALAFLFAGCQQGNDAEMGNDEKAREAQTQIADEDKMAYAIGTDMGNSILRLNEEYEALAMDPEVVGQGFADALNKQSILSNEEVSGQMQAFQQKSRLAQQQKMQARQASIQAENTAYLEKMAAEGFTNTGSGLLYKVVEAGADGTVKPGAEDRVKVHYTGTLTDGTQFDSSVGRAPFEFSLSGGVIKGWLEAVRLMPVGSKYRFVIPPQLGYGDSANARIPASSILIFDIELLEILESAASQ